MKYNTIKNYEYIKSHVPKDRLDQFLEEHDKQIRESVIDEVKEKLMSNGFIWTQHALEVWNEIAEQLKENK